MTMKDHTLHTLKAPMSVAASRRRQKISSQWQQREVLLSVADLPSLTVSTEPALLTTTVTATSSTEGFSPPFTDSPTMDTQVSMDALEAGDTVPGKCKGSDTLSVPPERLRSPPGMSLTKLSSVDSENAPANCVKGIPRVHFDEKLDGSENEMDKFFIEREGHPRKILVQRKRRLRLACLVNSGMLVGRHTPKVSPAPEQRGEGADSALGASVDDLQQNQRTEAEMSSVNSRDTGYQGSPKFLRSSKGKAPLHPAPAHRGPKSSAPKPSTEPPLPAPTSPLPPLQGDMVALLDSSVGRLELFLQSNLREEMLLGKREMMPRRFKNNKKLFDKCQETSHKLNLQELLVALTQIKERKMKLKRLREAAAKVVTKNSEQQQTEDIIENCPDPSPERLQGTKQRSREEGAESRNNASDDTDHNRDGAPSATEDLGVASIVNNADAADLSRPGSESEESHHIESRTDGRSSSPDSAFPQRTLASASFVNETNTDAAPSVERSKTTMSAKGKKKMTSPKKSKKTIRHSVSDAMVARMADVEEIYCPRGVRPRMLRVVALAHMATHRKERSGKKDEDQEKTSPVSSKSAVSVRPESPRVTSTAV